MAAEAAPVVPIAVHEDDRKLFVGALPQEAKETDIKVFWNLHGD